MAHARHRFEEGGFYEILGVRLAKSTYFRQASPRGKGKSDRCSRRVRAPYARGAEDCLREQWISLSIMGAPARFENGTS